MIQIDMPMPRDCVECPLTYPIHDGGAEYCCLTDVPEYIYRYGERPAECPLREVEDPWIDLQKKLEQWMAEKRIKFYSLDDEYLDTDDIKRGVEG